MEKPNRLYFLLIFTFVLPPFSSAQDLKKEILKQSYGVNGKRTQQHYIQMKEGKQPFSLWREATSHVFPDLLEQYLDMSASFGSGKDSSAWNGIPYLERMEQKRETGAGTFNRQRIDGYYGLGGESFRWNFMGNLERTGSGLPDNTPIFLSFVTGPSFHAMGADYGFLIGGEYSRYAASTYAKTLSVEGFASFPVQNEGLSLFGFLDYFDHHQIVLSGDGRYKLHPEERLDSVEIGVNLDLISHSRDGRWLLSNGLAFQTEGRLRVEDDNDGLDLFMTWYSLDLIYRMNENFYFSGDYQYNLAFSPNEAYYQNDLDSDQTASAKRAEVRHGFGTALHYQFYDRFMIHGYTRLLYNSSNIEWYDWSKLVYGADLQWTY